MSRSTWSLGVVLLLALALAAGCGSAKPSPTHSVSPLPTATEPGPAEPTPVEGPAFSLAKPLSAGDTQVTGTGPVDLTIVIADVTLMGQVLGRGQIGPSGDFVISVAPPLIVNHQIGIMLDAEATEIEYTDELFARLESLRGEGAILIPRVGQIYAAASVQP